MKRWEDLRKETWEQHHADALIEGNYTRALYWWARGAADEHKQFMLGLNAELHKELRWQHWQALFFDACLLIVSIAAIVIAVKHW